MSTRASFSLPSLRWPSQIAIPTSPGGGGGGGNAVVSPRSFAGRLSGILTPPLLSPQARHHNDDDNKEQGVSVHIYVLAYRSIDLCVYISTYIYTYVCV